MASVFLLLSIIISVTMGIAANAVIFRLLNKNLLTFLLSLLGIPIVAGMLQGIGNSMISGNVGMRGIGLAIGVGIGMIIGVNCYVAATMGTSARRWWKKRKQVKAA